MATHRETNGMEYLRDALTFDKILCGDLIILIEPSNQRTREQIFGDRSKYVCIHAM